MFLSVCEFQSLFLNPQNISLQNYLENPEGSEYSACQFDLHSEHIFFRSSKITPTKTGQFVTFWKRNNDGITQPYDQKDTFDQLIVYTKTSNKQGFFMFPKNILLDHNIISKNNIGGKRGFRVYTTWDIVDNKQAQNTQNWMIKYFTELPK